ncbi:histidine phosphatase superfamily [Hyaloscypha finlandica]|nr:histidine phosphatase superfamily [Hyaloscypha finlandica]
MQLPKLFKRGKGEKVVAQCEIPAKPAKIIFHLIRHAQADHDDMSNDMTEEERLSLDDPELTKTGKLQAANLGKSFSRIPLLTHIICSPSRRSIQTAIHAFGRAGCEIVIAPDFKEFTSFNCDQPLPFDILEKQFRKHGLDWSIISKYPNYWRSSFRDGTNISLEQQAEFCRDRLYVSCKESLEHVTNVEGNCEIAIIGHVVSLNCLIGNLTYAQRKARPWEHTEYRTFEFIPDDLLANFRIKPHNAYEEIVHNGKAHLQTFTPAIPRPLKEYQGGLKEGVSGPELPGFEIRPAHPIPHQNTRYKDNCKSLVVSFKGQKVLISSAEAADTLGVSAGFGREGGNVVFGFDQGAFPVVDAPAPAAVQVLPRNALIHMAHNADRDGWKTGVVTGMTEAEEEAAAGDLSD